MNGRPFRISCASTDGSVVSRTTTLTRPASMPADQLLQAGDVHGLVQAVGQRLADEHVIGDLERAGRDVLLAGRQRREHGRHQVVGLHPLDGGRVLLAAAHPQHGQRRVQVPPPPGREHRRGEYCLADDLLDGAARRGTSVPARAGSCAAARATARSRRRWPRPAARSRTSRRTACAAPARARGSAGRRTARARPAACRRPRRRTARARSCPSSAAPRAAPAPAPR